MYPVVATVAVSPVEARMDGIPSWQLEEAWTRRPEASERWLHCMKAAAGEKVLHSVIWEGNVWVQTHLWCCRNRLDLGSGCFAGLLVGVALWGHSSTVRSLGLLGWVFASAPSAAAIPLSRNHPCGGCQENKKIKKKTWKPRPIYVDKKKIDFSPLKNK